MKITVLVDPSSVIITMHLVCLNQSIEEDFKRNNAFPLYDLHGNALIVLAKNPCPRGHEIHNVDGPFLGYYTCILMLSVLGEEKKIFKE